MAINPNILLTPATADIGNTLIKGFQTGQQLAQSYQQARQEAELQPKRQRLLEAQISQAEAQAAGAPAEAEALQIRNQLNRQSLEQQELKVAALTRYNVVKRLTPLVQANDAEGVKNIFNSLSDTERKYITPEETELMTGYANKGNFDVINSALNEVAQNAYEIGVAVPTKPTIQEGEDPITGQRAFGVFNSKSNKFEVVPGLIPGNSMGQISNKYLELEDVKARTKVVNAEIENLLKNQHITDKQAMGLRAQLSSGDLPGVGLSIANLMNMRGGTDAQFAARDAQAAVKMAEFEANKRFAIENSKNNIDTVKAANATKAATQSQIALYQQALTMLEQGAETGPVDQLLMSFRPQTVELLNLQKQIGLAALANTNLTPVSNVDLQIIMESAIPLGLDRPQAMDWVKRKIATLEKTNLYTDATIRYFDRPGASMSKWIDEGAAQTFNLIGGGTATTSQQMGTGDVPIMQEQIPAYSPRTPLPPSVINYDPATGAFSDQ